jgi:hypothetical protein
MDEHLLRIDIDGELPIAQHGPPVVEQPRFPEVRLRVVRPQDERAVERRLKRSVIERAVEHTAVLGRARRAPRTVQHKSADTAEEDEGSRIIGLGLQMRLDLRPCPGERGGIGNKPVASRLAQLGTLRPSHLSLDSLQRSCWSLQRQDQ